MMPKIKKRLMLFILLFSATTLLAEEIDYYPKYNGFPPKYTGPGYYQLDLLQAKEDGVNDNSYPLYFEPLWQLNKAKVGVLIIHGYTSGPLQNIELQKFLYEKNIASYALRLPGHGTSIEDLKNQNIEDWLKAIQGPLKFLRARCDKIYIYGVCAGGSLALITAADNTDIKGIILQAPLVRSALNPLYTLTPVIPVADFFKIDLGITYVNIGMNSRHYCYPYNPLRSNFQVLRATLQARRKLQNIKVPILSIHSREDNVADPESEYYMTAFSRTPRTKVLWYGSEHTPLIHPNDDIFSDIYDFIVNPEDAVKTKGKYDHANTEIIENNYHEKPFAGIFAFEFSSINNSEYLIEVPRSNFGESCNFLYARKNNQRVLGWGFTSDHVNDDLNPSDGYKYDLRLVLLTQNLKSPWLWGVFQLHHEFLWQHILSLNMNYLANMDSSTALSYRFPLLQNAHNDLYLQGELAQDNIRAYGTLNMYLFRQYKLSCTKPLDSSKIYFGIKF